jgi:hypothetical protein
VANRLVPGTDGLHLMAPGAQLLNHGRIET